MERQKSKHGIVQRIFFGLVGGLGILLLTKNVIDGVIYVRGDGIARAENPIAFWLMAFFMLVGFGAALYWALGEAGRGETDDIS